MSKKKLDADTFPQMPSGDLVLTYFGTDFLMHDVKVYGSFVFSEELREVYLGEKGGGHALNYESLATSRLGGAFGELPGVELGKR
ncbi:unnamed protein product [Bursaphelenchus xylophilus]|uniref:(pine wood nematode) hypothetical protein n=1 Tax=Bursaphelenchus xylophilus TaxID=6326 RepID=A0A1I7RNZ3_BURXY|nr:unnamed protein product [Bursaphelenchus xylophilus]CAG9124404.1 unnamed protein product [Bursaphelenchus xylophilus]